MVGFLRRIAPWCFALALVVYLRPYTGIRHDATLYLVQALRLIDPDIFNGDLFFIAGSQADFTLFPQIIALFLRVFEPGDVFLWGSLAGRIVFYVASWYLVRHLFAPDWRWSALLVLIIMPTRYGPYSIFAYAEPFLTSRPWAEAVSLFALGLLVQRRTLAALVCLALAGVLHPLQGLAAAMVGWCWLVAIDRRWLWALLAVVPVALLGLAGIKPFNGLFATIDYDWWELIYEASGQIYLASWETRDWCLVIGDFYLLYLLYQRLDEGDRLRQFCTAVLAALAIGMASTAILADLSQLVLPTGLQLWRVLWLAHWLVVASLPWLIWDQWRRGGRDMVATVLLVAIAVLGASIARTTLPWAVLGVIPLHMAWPHVAHKVSRPVRWFTLAGLAGVLGIAIFRYMFRAWIVFVENGSDWERVRQDVVVISYPLIIAAIVVVLTWIFSRVGKRGSAALGGLSLAFLVGALGVWDSRSPWSRTMEYSRGNNVFGYEIPRAASVYWYQSEPSPLGPWLVLNRANYFSIFQMSGQMFNRETSMAGVQRRLQSDPVQTQGTMCSFLEALNDKPGSCWISEAALEYLCTPYKDVPAPDFFVLPFKQPADALGEWSATHPRTGELLATFYLYSCRDWAKSGGYDSTGGGGNE